MQKLIREKYKSNSSNGKNCLKNRLNWRYIIFSNESDFFPHKQGKSHYRKYLGKYVYVDFGPEYTYAARKINFVVS